VVNRSTKMSETAENRPRTGKLTCHKCTAKGFKLLYVQIAPKFVVHLSIVIIKNHLRIHCESLACWTVQGRTFISKTHVSLNDSDGTDVITNRMLIGSNSGN
jgi:hypothetical protein